MRGTVRGDERDERRTHLGEADGVRALTEALTADVEAVLADQTSLVLADAAAGARGGRERVSFEVPVASRPAARSCARSSRTTRASLGHEQRALLLRSPTGAGAPTGARRAKPEPFRACRRLDPPRRPDRLLDLPRPRRRVRRSPEG